MSHRPESPPPVDDDAFLQSLAAGLARVVEAARTTPEKPESGRAGGDLDIELAPPPTTTATGAMPSPVAKPAESPAPIRPPSPAFVAAPARAPVPPSPPRAAAAAFSQVATPASPAPAVARSPAASLPERAVESLRRAAAAPRPAPVPAPKPAPTPVPAASPTRTAAPPPPPRRPSRILRRAVPGIALLAAGLAIAGFSLWQRAQVGGPTVAAIEALPPTAAGPARGAPQQKSVPTPSTLRFQVASDADASTEVRMLGELTRAILPDGVVLTQAGAASAPRLGILRYDALRPTPAGWRFVAPMHIEAVYAVVRADSPLRFLHELRGRRIDVGAAGSARALSGASLYRHLFGTTLPSSPAAALPPAEALQALVQGRGLDAVLLFDGQPSRWLQALPADTRDQLRLLELAPDNPASRRALQTYLSASVEPLMADGAATAVPTLGVVAFLAAPAQSPGLGRLVQALCEQLPTLRRTGDPAWREVQPALQLPGGSPPTYEVSAALQSCATSPAAAVPSTPVPGA